MYTELLSQIIFTSDSNRGKEIYSNVMKHKVMEFPLSIIIYKNSVCNFTYQEIDLILVQSLFFSSLLCVTMQMHFTHLHTFHNWILVYAGLIAIEIIPRMGLLLLQPLVFCIASFRLFWIRD